MDVLTFSRLQFGDTAAFHILWPIMSIGLSLYMLVMEVAWLYTGNESYYRQLRFWTKIFILTFAMGTASGIPLQFEFGTNWAAFSAATGDFFGNILGFESTVAFALEAAFLGIFVFGWNKVGRGAHLFANAMIFVGATLSAFWIMAANSWMQIPVGVVVEGSKLIVSDYMAAIFNPGTIVSFLHMWVACIESTLFMMTGICAMVLLFGTRDTAQREFFLTAFKYCVALAIIIVPIQLGIGHVSGETVAKYQPAKLAATELHWDTNAPGTGAALNLFAWPAAEGGRNSFALAIPGGLSFITTVPQDGVVRGLNSFPAADRPTTLEATIVFYSFRLMVGIGVVLLLLMFAGAWYWGKGRLTLAKIDKHRVFWWLWVLALPLGFIATEAGWMVREIGRQPWVVYNLMRTSEGLSSNLNVVTVAATTIIFTLLYLIFGALFIYFTYRIVKKGPDLTTPV